MTKTIAVNGVDCGPSSSVDLQINGVIGLKRWLIRTTKNVGSAPLNCEDANIAANDTATTQHRPHAQPSIARTAKLAFDCAAALAGIVVLSPFLGLIAIAVKSDGGPVFFGHTRIGRDGRRFNCLKFRSMVTNSAAVLADLLANDPAAAAEWEATQKLKNDPRITAVGRLLRASSLDEMPQLLNVLCLDMSLVGPRPIVEAEVARYGENIAQYYAGRPGLTGLWQVSGRSNTSYAERVALDTQYVSTWSFWQDVSILARTIPAVMRRRGAC
jgi:undecaprenyl-phosphate galactose phosphotransferase